MSAVTGFAGAVSEAWSELKYGKTRVLLSLVGVAIAIAALTAVVALGQIATQALTEQSERSSGRPATLYLSMYDPSSATPLSVAETDKAFASVVQRYKIDYASRTVYTSADARTLDGTTEVSLTAVDQPYGQMHRIRLAQGSWFAPGDAARLAPALVINEKLWQALGSPALAAHPILTGLGQAGATGVVIGITPSSEFDAPSAFVLADAMPLITGPDATSDGSSPNYEMWVPPEVSSQLADRITSDVAGQLGSGVEVDVNRQDYLAHGGDDPLLVLKLGVGGIAGLVLLLGALSLLNISLVTVRYRIREIGIRRSFGATAGRVFFSVMMESVVATAVAGFVGVIIAVLVVQSPLVQDGISGGVQDLPPFPVSAAFAGLGAATLVGALAGLLPALVAVRVRVIDAIRY